VRNVSCQEEAAEDGKDGAKVEDAEES